MLMKRRMLFYSALLMAVTVPFVFISPVVAAFTAGGSVTLLVVALKK